MTDQAAHWALPALISEDWLKSVGFKWHQLNRQPSKHWLLWLGSGLNEGPCLTSYEDIGIELAANFPSRKAAPEWFCWFRSDSAGRYHRFIHLRHLTTTTEVIRLVEAITGFPFDPANNIYGSVHTPLRAAAIREEDAKRLDRQMMLEASPHQKWSDVEKDDTRGRALPEHLEAHEKVKG